VLGLPEISRVMACNSLNNKWRIAEFMCEKYIKYLINFIYWIYALFRIFSILLVYFIKKNKYGKDNAAIILQANL
jgi:hypothetical protein